MEIRFCTNRGKPFEFLEEEYYKVKDMITNIVSGPDFFNRDNYLLENKEYIFEFNYLDRFYLVSKPDELNVKIYDNKLFVSGPKGKYQLVFKKKPLENKPFISERIISNGQNEVFSYSNFNDKEYVVNIIIDSVNLNILILDENNKALTDKCIILQNEKEYLSYCTNVNGIINAKGLLKGKYNILFEGTDEYEKINQDIDLNSDSMIKLKLILKNKDNVINNNNNSENIDNIDNNQNINDNLNNNDDNEQTSITQVNGEKNTNEDYLIFKDTLSINKFYIVAIVFIFLTAVVLCIKRLKK